MRAPKPHTETRKDAISFRTWPSLRFAVDFAARVKGETLSTFCESVLLPACEVQVPGTKLTYRDFDHPHEGVVWIKMALELRIPMSGDEERRRRFVLAHKEFFVDNKGQPDEKRITVLWRLIAFFEDDWERTHTIDANATANRMADALRQAKLEPPGKHK